MVELYVFGEYKTADLTLIGESKGLRLLLPYIICIEIPGSL